MRGSKPSRIGIPGQILEAMGRAILEDAYEVSLVTATNFPIPEVSCINVLVPPKGFVLVHSWPTPDDPAGTRGRR